MFRTLLWKEWIEQRWRIAFGCTIIGSLTILGFYVRMMSDQNVADNTAALAGLLTFLVGIGLIAPERESGTLQTLLILPIRPRAVLIAKLLIALVASLAPIATAALVARLMAAGREVPASRLLFAYLLACPLALTLLIWTTALTVRARTEAIAGLFTIILLTVVGLFGLVNDLFHLHLGYLHEATNPMLFGKALRDGPYLPQPGICATQTLIALALIAILFWQFPRIGRSK